ncbi:hypothetical protein KQI82_13310 [Oscillibacter sp. MSJ-2]|uniref:Uncharacterized protein n=1 Tax=Dysosmobacter acutus TaxID=2841504 RepID=A0ABS6FC81_9FIRM|nr:DUF6092 family protein [Dysosmobacter acutus]MBU5627884.1 hypothetical protein [Dysosmobacter acutus]
MNNAASFQQEPEGYVPIRLLDGVIGILEILALEDKEYELLMQRIYEAKAFAVDDTEKMIDLLNQLILENVRSRRARENR